MDDRKIKHQTNVGHVRHCDNPIKIITKKNYETQLSINSI
jgi:hypothetical protein